MSATDTLSDAINSHDPDRIAACFTPDYRCEMPLRPYEGFVGIDQVRKNWTGMLSSVPDLRATVLRSAENGDESWSEWEMVGTNAAGALAVLRGPVVLTARDGRIDWSRFYLDPVQEQPDR